MRASVAKFERKFTTHEGMCVGRIVSLDERGFFLVDFHGNDTGGPVSARMTTSAWTETDLRQNYLDREVLLAFEDYDPDHPIIVDTMHCPIKQSAETVSSVAEAEKTPDVFIDGKRITFHAEEEIVLTCGKSSITLTKAGKVIVKGTDLLSQSVGAIRMKGGCISIN